MHGSSKRRDDKLKRLRRIEGQVRGLQRMIEEDRYCIDILTQMAAVRAALQKVEAMVLEDHAATCVSETLKQGDPEDQRRKMAELIELLRRYSR
ncbi:MAG: transcriptional regulator [Alphaproteobacteria bacterium]|nr:MAG: transcriptional regulator [Alphaproteobacteria bacterium]